MALVERLCICTICHEYERVWIESRDKDQYICEDCRADARAFVESHHG